MEIKELYTFDIIDGKVVYKKEQYKVWERDGLLNVSNMKETSARLNMSESLYNRIYGESIESIVANRRKWLIEIIMPEKLNYINDVNNEIIILSIFLNQSEIDG